MARNFQNKRTMVKNIPTIKKIEQIGLQDDESIDYDDTKDNDEDIEDIDNFYDEDIEFDEFSDFDKDIEEMGENLAVFKYSYNTFCQLFKKIPRKDFDELTLQNKFLEFIDDKLEQMEDAGENISKVKVIVLDEDFLKLARSNRNLNEQEIIQKYLDNLDDEVNEEKFQKYEFGDDYTVCAIDFLAIADEHENFKDIGFKLSSNTAMTLKRYLEKIYQGAKIFIPGYVFKDDLFIDEQETLIKKAKEYFKTGKVKIPSDWDNQKIKKDVNLAHMCIPYVTKATFKTEIDLDELYSEDNILYMPSMMCFDKEGLKELNIKQYPLKGSDLEKSIIKDIKNGNEKIEVEVSDCACDMSDLPDIYEDIQKALEGNVKMV